MAFIRIHCDVCGRTWEAYMMRQEPKGRECPHCFARIDKDIWENAVVPAAEAVQHANESLYRAHMNNHQALFSMDVIANHLYKNRNEERD